MTALCGPGGMGLGAKKAIVKYNESVYKIKHQWASDYDKDSCLTYKRNISSNGKIFNQDVKSLDIKSLGEIDIFAYGFPCNDFSIVGEHKGANGKFGPLYKYGVSVLDTYNPKAFLAENVGGLSSANNGKTFIKILEDLQNAGKGYNLTVHKYKFEEYGIPQIRHRIVIVGIRKDLKTIFKIPKQTHIKKHITAQMALENPPIKFSLPNHDFMKVSDKTVERLKYIKPWKNIWNSNMPDHLKINCSGAQLSQIYKRLDKNKPSYTITGSGGGGTYCYHWEENRPLTNRERARLQTFPDDFIFVGNKSSIRKQIGMAVPPQFSKILFESVIKTVFKIPYLSIHSNEESFKDNISISQMEMSL